MLVGKPPQKESLMIKPLYTPDISRGIGGDKKPLTDSQKKTVDAFLSVLKEDSYISDMFKKWSPMMGNRKVTVKMAHHA